MGTFSLEYSAVIEFGIEVSSRACNTYDEVL